MLRPYGDLQITIIIIIITVVRCLLPL